ncbi:hypothetical protein D1007_44667 [Hordeum vulgare]|nr:hypothetical protein D1007_44667 [Hordeum vulgare]
MAPIQRQEKGVIPAYENLGYETAGRIDIYLLLPGMQMNEGGLKLLSSNNDTNIIREVVRQGYKYLMFYLDHVDSYVGGGWDDVVANPHLPLEISPQKSSRGESTCEGISRGRRNRSAIIEEREDEGSTSDSDDSDYDPKELVDIDYDLQDGDKDLVMDEPHVADDEKKDPAGMGIFEVDDRDVQLSVDINLKKCSCRRWDLTGIPCCHGISACRYENIPPESMVHKCYSIDTYRKAYAHIIMPCKDAREWQSMFGKEIIPPKVKTKKGRKQKNRRKQPEEKEGRAGKKVGRGGAVIHCSHCGAAGHNIGGCKDFKLGLKPKKRGQKNRVRAEPEEPNLQTMELAHHDPLNYEDTIISSLMEEHQACQNLEQREPDPMPGSSFIADHVQSQSPVQPTTITKEGNVIRKREVLAIAKLRAAAEKREIADQAKFNAAMAKLREEELKILQAEQKRKEQTAAKKWRKRRNRKLCCNKNNWLLKKEEKQLRKGSKRHNRKKKQKKP